MLTCCMQCICCRYPSVVRPAAVGEEVTQVLTYKGRTKRLFLFALFSPLAPLLYIWTVTYVSAGPLDLMASLSCYHVCSFKDVSYLLLQGVNVTVNPMCSCPPALPLYDHIRKCWYHSCLPDAGCCTVKYCITPCSTMSDRTVLCSCKTMCRFFIVA
jgi:hypothetical protein